jgi:hypothetical protein
VYAHTPLGTETVAIAGGGGGGGTRDGRPGARPVQAPMSACVCISRTGILVFDYTRADYSTDCLFL